MADPSRAAGPTSDASDPDASSPAGSLDRPPLGDGPLLGDGPPLADGPPIGAATSAAPPTGARLAAFMAIVVAGVCGGLIGYAVTDMGCGGDCRVAAGGVGLGAAVLAAVGVAIVAVLVLRAMGEWVRADRSRLLPPTARRSSPVRPTRRRRIPRA